MSEEMEEAFNEDGENVGREVGVAPALIAVHPLEHSIVVAVGSELRIYDLKGGQSIALMENDSTGPSHSDAIRALCFSVCGRVFASAGDDKLVKIWNTDTWQCMRTVSSEKRVSAVAISQDGIFLTFADKFGVVWVVDLEKNDERPTTLLAHYCSMITSLVFSPDGRYIASADRDFKIRITVFPKRPLNGAHEIQSFCLGHTDFVTCLAFMSTSEHPQGFLLSGSGDSTVRMWDFISGSLLDTCDVRAKAKDMESNVEGCPCVVTDIHASSNGSLVAVAIQNMPTVVLICCNFSTRFLSVTKVVTLGENFSPTSIGMSYSADRLWVVAGASNLPTSLGPLALVRVVSLHGNDQSPTVLEEDAVPGGKELLGKLQGSAVAEKQGEALAAAAAAVKMAMCNLLIKKDYSMEKRELRKKCRNDRKLRR